MPAKSCDLCRRRKTKCVFDNGSDSCRPCSSRIVQCTFARRRPRMGRRPVVKQVPYGSCGVLNLGSESDSYANPPDPQNKQAGDATAAEPPLIRMLAHSPVGPTPKPALRTSHLPKGLALAAGIADRKQLVVEILDDKGLFYAFHRHFMIGPSFADGFRTAIQTVFLRSNGALSKAYQAILDLWDIPHHRVRYPDEINLAQGRECLRCLQNTPIMHVEDSAAVLMLGQVLLVYHILTRCASAQTIIRHALLSAKQCYGALLMDPNLDPITVTPILLDTVESLVRREVPVVQIPTNRRLIIDRSVGLCWTLLPLLQDLCTCSFESKVSVAASLTSGNFDTHHFDGTTLSDTERSIERWEPTIPPSLHEKFTAPEISAMHTQARVYRIAALLIIHRLRYPLGTEDEVARRKAEVICSDLSAFLSWAPEDMRGLSVGLPLLTAMLETKDAGKLLRQFAPFASDKPQHAGEVENFIELAWVARERGFQGLWFELIGSRSRMPIIP